MPRVLLQKNSLTHASWRNTPNERKHVLNVSDNRPELNVAELIGALNAHGVRFVLIGGIAAQIQGHKPQGVRENNYIRRPLDLLRKWHVKIEAWILEQAGIEFVPVAAGLRVVPATR